MQAAYSNPRVKVPKVEELLVEEWGQLKPTQAGMSAYSLHSYLKRFDNLKAELVGAQEEVRRRKEALSKAMIKSMYGVSSPHVAFRNSLIA